LTDRWLLTLLACPVCGGHPLALDATNSDGDLIYAGRLSCAACGRSYAIEDGVADLLPDELSRDLAAGDGRWDRWRELMSEFITWRERTWGTLETAGKQQRRGEALHRAFIDFCEPCSEEGNLLDIGCGTGHVRDLLPDGCRYVGVDPLPAGRDPRLRSLPAHIPRPEGDLRVVQAVGEALPFWDSAFDSVVMMGSLDHCNEPERVISEAYRILRPGGVMGVLQGLSASAGPRSRGKRVLRWIASLASRGVGTPCAAATHGHAYTVESLTGLVEGHFEHCESETVAGRVFVKATKPEESEAHT